MTTNPDDLFLGLPGEAMIRQGLVDWRAGRSTVASCLVAIASPRLQRIGLIGGNPAFAPADAESQLYRLLCKDGGDAYSRYNALLRELISFEQSLDRRIRESQVLCSPLPCP